jgi:GNAT superfamily N-acetyltransferase
LERIYTNFEEFNPNRFNARFELAQDFAREHGWRVVSGVVQGLKSDGSLYLPIDHAWCVNDTDNVVYEPLNGSFIYENTFKTAFNPKISNILDPIQPGLDPDVFDNAESDNPLLKPVLARWVKNTVHKIFKNNGYDDSDRWLKLVLTGSLTTLQWSPESDFDISLWVDLEEFEDFDRAELVKMIVDKLDGTMVPGTTHPLQCFVVNMFEVHNASDIYKPGLRSAWDIDEHRWIVPPETDRVHDVGKEYPDLYHRGLQVAEKMKSLLDYQPERAKTYWHYIHSQRRRAMKAGRGDYSPENITYKMLANSNLFPRIEEATGEHIASNLQYIETTFEDGDIIYHNLKAILPTQTVKTASIESIDDYELNKIHTAAGEVAQFSWVEIPGFKTESEGVEVHPDYRRKGIASKLISIAKEISPDLKASKYRTEDGDRFIKSTHILDSPEDVEKVHLEPRYAQSPSPQYLCTVCQNPTDNINPKVCDACRNLEGGNTSIDSSSEGTTMQERINFAAGDEIHEFK